MSASAETLLQSALWAAKAKRIDLRGAIERERDATVAFMDEALQNAWSWERIGEALGITGTAARRYHMRNRRKVRAVTRVV